MFEIGSLLLNYTVLDVPLLQIKIPCCTANPTADIE